MSEKDAKIRSLSVEDMDFNNFNGPQNSVFRYEDVVIVNNIHSTDQNKIIQQGVTYRTGEHRIIIAEKGFLKGSLNLMQLEVHGGNVVFIPKGTILQIDRTSDDVCGCGLLFSNPTFLDENFSPNQNSVIIPDKKQWNYIIDLRDMIKRTTDKDVFNRNTFYEMVKAFIANVLYLSQLQRKAKETVKQSRQSEIFNRFLALVDNHAAKERDVKFYADKLFLSEKYLSAVIKRESGQTVMQWVNKRTILEAMILLKQGDMTIYQVADELNFANASFFTKYFKRITGLTPKEYQKQ